MGAPKGNEYYKLAKNPGKKKLFNPQEFKAVCSNYFRHIDENPHEKRKTETSNKEIKEYIEYVKRPYTLEGLCNFIGISLQTFYNLEIDKDFIDVIARTRQIIYESKLDGATAGLFNANIVIRDLQLKDTATVTHEQGVKSLGAEEIKQLKTALSDMYGTIQPLTIDIEAEEG